MLKEKHVEAYLMNIKIATTKQTYMRSFPTKTYIFCRGGKMAGSGNKSKQVMFWYRSGWVDQKHVFFKILIFVIYN